MCTAFRPPKNFLTSVRVALLPLLFLLGLLLSFYPAQGKTETQNEAIEVKKTGRQDEWMTFPYTVQLSPYRSFTQYIPQKINLEGDIEQDQSLRIRGINADIGVYQIRRFFWKYFHCYPKLGLLVNYGRLENKGSTIGGLVYLAPQHDHQALCELVPRLGIGVAYVNVPGTNLTKEAKGREEKEKVYDKDQEEDIYRQGISLDLSLALACQVRCNPNWALSPSIGFNYMPYFTQKETEEVEEEKYLKIITAGLGFNYTPNPSYVRYSNPKGLKSNRVDIGFLSALKKNKPFSQKQLTQQEGTKKQLKQKEEDDSSDKYYYVGGMYGHWSLWLGKNHAFTLATEWIKDWATKEVIKKMVKTDHLKIALLVGHEFLWGKLIFGQQLGFYLVNNAIQTDGFCYTRLGLEYRITDFFFIGTSLKTALKITEKDFSAETDFIDFRIGYEF